jgi:probable F420-dependent oxidoreductase
MRVEAFALGADWRAVATAAQRAEALGFDNFAAPEIESDPFLPLAVAALATERIGLRTAIAVAFPRSPMVVAQIAWGLQVNSRGRFTLGLGTQVKGHNERRFSVPWREPARRLREYVEALRAIWRCWEKGEPLAYTGTHYRFTLMTPEFSPSPSRLPPVPVYIAAVRPAMLRLAGRICDGVRLHGFCTRRYLVEVALPSLETGRARGGRARERFEVCGGGFIATGRDEAAVARAVEGIRYRIAFYGSTRTYLPVLSLHGWDDLGAKLHRLSKEGRWQEMAREVPDDVVREFTAIAPYDGLQRAIEQRFGGLSDSLELGFPDDVAPGEARELLADIRRIPSRFDGRAPSWDRP